VIGDERKDSEKTEFVCSWCNCSLVRLSDKNNQSERWFCRNCSIEFDPEDEKIRHKQRLSIPAEDVEPAIASIDVTPDVSILHEPKLRGGFTELQKKGLKIKDYQTTEKE
jgi:hypothetical protein